MQEIPSRKPHTLYVQKSTLTAFALLLLVGGAYFMADRTVEAEQERIACEVYASKEVAQKLLDEHPEKYQRLDRDHDGIACESL